MQNYACVWQVLDMRVRDEWPFVGRSVLPAVLFADPKESKGAEAADSEGSAAKLDSLLAKLPRSSTREQVRHCSNAAARNGLQVVPCRG